MYTDYVAPDHKSPPRSFVDRPPPPSSSSCTTWPQYTVQRDQLLHTGTGIGGSRSHSSVEFAP